jgi:hypothetical protein
VRPTTVRPRSVAALKPGTLPARRSISRGRRRSG